MEHILAPGGLRTVFQPVYDVSAGTPRLHALECLTRGPADTNAASAAVLFEYVRRKRMEVAVDRAAIRQALQSARELPQRGAPLALNVHASTLARDPRFVPFLVEAAAAAAVPLGRLTLELVEHGPALDGHSFSGALARLRGLGVRIALDDVGVGASNLKLLLDCRPDYVKIDRHFVSGCDGDLGRLAVLEAVARLGRHLGAAVVVEGVERAEELRAVIGLGIELVQGFLLCPPLRPADLLARLPFLAA
jgi:EAL domain-containing protein (putative c-di-GMP-specific phosphodiesterase class I)